MKRLIVILVMVVVAIPLSFVVAQQSSLDRVNLRAEAERFYAEKAYQRAYEIYRDLSVDGLSEDEKRWIAFRVADTRWRAAAGGGTSFPPEIEAARFDLEKIITESERAVKRDRVWAEAQESLADLLTIGQSNLPGAAASRYLTALDWWGAQSDLDLARERYLGIVWKMTDQAWREIDLRYPGRPTLLSDEILENALEIAKKPEDRARAAYLLAVNYSDDSTMHDEAEDAFEIAVREAKGTPWLDDILYTFAQWTERNGHATELPNGTWQFTPDYVKALALYRRLVAEYSEGESRFYRPAQEAIRNITTPTLAITASNFFLPGSKVEFAMTSRNIDEVTFDLYATELLQDVRVGRTESVADWINGIDPRNDRKVASWSRSIAGSGEHEQRFDRVVVDRDLPRGAYVVVARAGDAITARELLLVSDIAVVMRSAPDSVVAWVADVNSGAPIAGARVRITVTASDVRPVETKTHDLVAGDDGIARLELSPGGRLDILAAAAKGDRQAFATTNLWSPRPGTPESWKIYAFTDRPAYRPEDRVQWKMTARLYDGKSYRTPSGAVLDYEIVGPNGTKVASGSATLNAFGSFWGSFDLEPTMPLGFYQLVLHEPGAGRKHIGSAPLFRLEEYKLPEFRVSVEIPRENGRLKSYRLGDKVTATIRAEYYFGGAVSNANVEVVVKESSFYHWWRAPREFDWYFDDRHWYGIDGSGGEVVKEETLRTGPDGTATISFNTKKGRDSQQYWIEARVTDASRREVVGTGNVRVARQSYFVHATPEHFLHRPKEKVTIDFHASDANDQPVQTTGTVRVSRQWWYEIWVDPEGNEVRGNDLERVRSRYGIFPPPPPLDGHPWRLKSRGWEEEDIVTQPVTTDAEGNGELTFTPHRDGYYRVRWSSDDRRDESRPKRPSDVIQAETAVWVASSSSTQLGYYKGGVQIILDRESFRAGATAPVMIVAPANDRHVLLTLEADRILDAKLLHLEGNVKLVEIELEEKHVPNFFISASTVFDRQLLGDTKEVIVPPTRQFIDVEVKSDAGEHQPRDKGRFVVKTRDDAGKPVAAEVAFSVSDQSVLAIQGELAGDPRQFFFGTKRRNSVRTTSSFQIKPYVRLVEGEKKVLVDERLVRREAKEERAESDFEGVAGGVLGGVVGGLYDSVAESITVTAQAAAPPSALPVPPPPPAPARAAPQEGGGDEVVVVRTDFRATALWIPDVSTAADGQAEVELSYPDSLTTWVATATAVSKENQFGRASTTTVTNKPLIVRLQAPRFFVVGDEATVSAVINNNTVDAMRVTPVLEAHGIEVTSSAPAAVDVPPNGDARVNWIVRATAAGNATLRMTGRGESQSDGMERVLPVVEHGIDKLVAVSGKTRGEETVVTVDIPRERRRESTKLAVQVTPSIAVTMLDALPYLVEFPYGCTEQTMSRFLPAAIVVKTLGDLGLSREEAARRIFGGVERSSAAKTHRDATNGLAKLEEVIAASLGRLYEFQHGDGGWGWWKDGESDPYMSAYVVWGLALARDGGVEIRRDVIDRGVEYLRITLVDLEERYDDQAWSLHALAAANQGASPHRLELQAVENLWANRDRLRPYSKALFALALKTTFGGGERAMTLARNLENGVTIDRTPSRSVISSGGTDAGAATMATARWGEDRFWWRWWDGPVESTAFAMRALLAIDPKNPLVEPAMNWLVKNRRGAQWSSTKDTAIAVLALNDYLRASGELDSSMAFEVIVNGTSIEKVEVSKKELLRAPSRFAIDPRHVRDGRNEITIRRSGGGGGLYFAAEARFFSLEEPVTPAANEIFVSRDYYRLVGRPTLLEGVVYERVPVEDGATVQSGDRIEVVARIEAKNDYEYLMFEDLKPAGFEAVALQSGEALYATQVRPDAMERTLREGRTVPVENEPGAAVGSTYVYQELRDRKVAMFIDKLEQGLWEIRYTLRAETPGRFHALPLIGQAMYVPEIRGNSEEIRVTVRE